MNANNKRICMLIESFRPVVGGMESQATALVDALSRRGFDVIVVTRRTEKNFLPREAGRGFSVFRVGPSGKTSRLRWVFLLTCLPTLWRRRRTYDLIFVPGLRVLGMAGILVSKLTGKPCILKADSEGEMSGSFFHAGLEKARINPGSSLTNRLINLRNRLLRKATHFISLHEDMTREYQAQGIPSGMISEIPNMVDTNQFQPIQRDDALALRRELELPPDLFLFLYVGRIVSYKGVPNLVKACARLLERKDLALVIPGSGGLDMYNCEDQIRSFR